MSRINIFLYCYQTSAAPKYGKKVEKKRTANKI